MLPFSTEEFLAVFVDYNESVWPAQWLLAAVGVGIACLCAAPVVWRGRVIAVSLALLWGWMAIAYHLLHFSRINPAAYGFAALFLAEAVLFLRFAAARDFEPAIRLDVRGALGIAMLGYALIVYPLLSAALGHRYPAMPTFGVPCPTTILTLGVLITAPARRVRVLAVVPVLWSLIGGSAAFLLGIWQDLGLILSGLLTAAAVGLCILRPCAD